MKHKTYLSGYYGMLNTGDDALLAVTAWGAKKYFGCQNISVSSPRRLTLATGQTVSSNLVERQRIKGENRLRQYATAGRCCSVIFGGGSVLHSAQDIGIKRHLIRLTNKDKAIAIGVSIGPFKDQKAERSCAKFLEECSFVGVRDAESFDIANAIAPSANVHLTFDLAPLLAEQTKLNINRNRQGVAVSLCALESLVGNHEVEEKRLVKIAKCLRLLYRETGEPITLIDFNGHNQFGDSTTHKKMQSRLPPNVINRHQPYISDPRDVLQLLSSFKLMIGMRLHAAIMAFVAGTPVISLNYHSKCKGWCDQIQIPPEYRFSAHTFDEAQLAQTAIDGIANGFVSPKLSRETAQQLALNNWRFCNEYYHADNFSNYSSL